MGLVHSLLSGAEPQPPPSVVLVPPLLGRERKGRSRFAKSSYDRLFGKPALAMLFGDYLGGDIRGVIHFTPPEDERISVTAKLGVPRAVALGAGAAVAPSAAGGSLTLRYQPSPDLPFSFVDIKARSRGATSTAALRACMFDPASRLAVFAELPVAGGGGGAASPAAALRLGAKYTSPAFSAGAVVDPAGSVLQQAFVVARSGGLTFGAQTAPALALGGLLAGGGLTDSQAWAAAAKSCQRATSYSVAYEPAVGSGGGGPAGGRFTAAVEVVEGRELAVSFLHHVAVQRRVRNPFEASDVVGITNYLDVGFRMASDLAGGRGSTMQLGAAWQANKNVLLKARVGLEGAALAAVLKSWWQPSFTLAGAAAYDWSRGGLRFGVTAAVESFKNIRYERSAAAQKMSGARVTQRHVAGADDVAYAAGKGLLVPLEEVDDPRVLGQVPASGEEYL